MVSHTFRLKRVSFVVRVLSFRDVSIDDSFAISSYAFKKQQRSYKRVINLDKKIQIIINGNRDHIEQGEDERGKYYKVYYREEE